MALLKSKPPCPHANVGEHIRTTTECGAGDWRRSVKVREVGCVDCGEWLPNLSKVEFKGVWYWDTTFQKY